MYIKKPKIYIKNSMKIEYKNTVKATLLNCFKCIRKLEKIQCLNSKENSFYLLSITTTVDHCIHSATVKSALKVQ